MVILYICIGLLLGAALGYLVAHSQQQAHATKAQMLTQQISETKESYEQQLATLKDGNDKQLSDAKDEYQQQLNNAKAGYEQQIATLKDEQAKQLNETKAGYEQQIATLKNEQAKQLSDTKADYEQRLTTLRENSAKQLTTAKDEYQQQLSDAKQRYEQQIKTLKEEHATSLAQLKQDLAEQQKQLEQLIIERFTTASEKELKSRSQELSAINSEQLSKILIPLQNNITQMKEAVEKSEKTQTETTSRLDHAISYTLKQTDKLGKTTDNLVSALSHDNKYQGNFGEMQLRQLLEDMGFTRGIQFEEQVTIRDDAGEAVHHEETGSRLQPDVIMHFPEERDIIIDAKTSMNAFLRYNDATLSDEQHQQALQDHLTAIKTQVKSLVKKNYGREYNKKGRVLDFVVMFVPSEAALQLALAEEPTLWNEAFSDGVFISGPQNLYTLLHLIDMAWKQKRQLESQQNIIAAAEEIVKRVQIFYERFQTVETCLKKTQEAFDKVNMSLSDTGQSIITSANKLIKYGAKEDKKKKSLPKPDDDQQLFLPLDTTSNDPIADATVINDD